MAVLVAAVVRPRGLPEAVVAVPAAALVLATRLVSWSHARAELTRLAPVVVFLGAVLVLAAACDRDGLFRALGERLARRSTSASALLGGVFALAAVTTAVLSLDTTVVLLTPVVAAAAARARVPARPHLFAAGHLANTASLLMPVSNLTNLLAVAVVPISFTRFTALMAGPWLVAVAAELVVFRWWFRSDLRVPPAGTPHPVPELPWFALGVVAATLAGFVVTSFAGVSPAWSAAVGAAVASGRQLLRRTVRPRAVVASTAPAFLVFVLALGVVVRAVSDHGLASGVRHVLPAGASLPALLGVAVVAAVLSNVVNNLPAALLLAPVLAPAGAAPVLAMLVGVNVGPNLTYVGSLATLLWRRVIRGEADQPTLREFTLLGAATVPVALVLAVGALWAAVRVVGTT